MTLIWTRVDQKLIHGQVSLGWVPYLRANALVLVDGDAADDPWAQKIMMLGLPPEIEATGFTPPDRLAEMLDADQFLSRRVLVVFKDLESALKLLEDDEDLPVKVLNLGNQAYRDPDRVIPIGEAFYASPKELARLAWLHINRGLKVVVQILPGGWSICWPPPGKVIRLPARD